MLTWTFADQLSHRRLSVADLQRLLPDGVVSQAQLYRLHSSTPELINLHTLDALCAALQCQPGDLMKWSVSPSADAVSSVLDEAKELARQEQRAKAREEADAHAARTQTVRNLVDQLAPLCSAGLARTLKKDPNQPPFPRLTWHLSKSGEEALDFRDDGLYFDPFRLELITNFDSLCIGARDIAADAGPRFSVSNGGGSYQGIHDLKSLGAAALGSPTNWDRVYLATEYT